MASARTSLTSLYLVVHWHAQATLANRDPSQVLVRRGAAQHPSQPNASSWLAALPAVVFVTVGHAVDEAKCAGHAVLAQQATHPLHFSPIVCATPIHSHVQQGESSPRPAASGPRLDPLTAALGNCATRISAVSSGSTLFAESGTMVAKVSEEESNADVVGNWVPCGHLGPLLRLNELEFHLLDTGLLTLKRRDLSPDTSTIFSQQQVRRRLVAQMIIAYTVARWDRSLAPHSLQRMRCHLSIERIQELHKMQDPIRQLSAIALSRAHSVIDLHGQRFIDEAHTSAHRRRHAELTAP